MSKPRPSRPSATPSSPRFACRSKTRNKSFERFAASSHWRGPRCRSSRVSERPRKDSGNGGLPWARDGEGELSMERVLRVDGELVDERLPTQAEVPEIPDFVEPEPAQVSKREEVSVEGYRRGLSLVREQKFEQALVELDAFSSEHPSHPYADNALFWCGEIHYLRHEYARALEYFNRIEKLHPWANKAPDALYRIGQIYLRRGDTARAQAYFDKVREQFPNTAAARLALRKDAS